MRFRKDKTTTIFLLVSLISISIINSSFILYKPTRVSKNQETDELMYENLKLSLIQDWNTSWDIGDNEYGYGIAVEESTGAIYVTGYNESTESDVVLIKYDNNGEELWNVTFDNGDNEFGYDVAIDSLGNVYVAGANGTFYPYWDVLLLKYNSSGHFEWARSWSRQFDDAAWSIDIDTDNNIYLTGTTYTTSSDLLILKYDSSGNYKWNSTIYAPESQVGYDLVLDSMNNIYIAGINGSITTEYDVYTAKFDSSGNQIWNQTWGQYGLTDQGFGVALDSNNNVYVTGKTESYGAIVYDYITIKYDNDGNWKWNQTWGTNWEDMAQSIAVDSDNNIYTCGYTTMCNVSIVKYSNSGDLIWEKTWANNSIYEYWWNDMVIDSLDRIYITGYNRTDSFGIYDIFTTKFSIESPASFNLTADCGAIDDDGIFNLNWTLAPRAVNYSIYQYNTYISEINDTLTSIVNQTQALSLPLSGYSNGTYYFKGVAFNIFGNSSSNCISVAVEIPPEDEETEPFIPGYNLMFVIIGFAAIVSILIYRRLKLK
ncbi:MAG: SBBP repeat-containing protein [Promethearchaeota archaeon]